MLNDFLKAVGPVIAGAMSQKFEKGDFRFADGSFKFDGDFNAAFSGVPLDELDLTEDAPVNVNVLGSAKVTIKQGNTFRVKASGDNADALRFALRDERLSVMTKGHSCEEGATAEVEITLPSVQKLSVAGSGTITSSELTGKVKATVAGSGSIELSDLAATRFNANVMGSGKLTASGSTEKMKLTIAGSGAADLSELQVGKAKVTVAGSGSTTFASDGQVKAQMMGAGNVTVVGRARCSVHSMGSGRLTCVDPDGEEVETETKSPKKPSKPKKAAKAKKAKAPKAAKAPRAAKPAKKAGPKRKPRSNKGN